MSSLLRSAILGVAETLAGDTRKLVYSSLCLYVYGGYHLNITFAVSLWLIFISSVHAASIGSGSAVV